LLAAFELTKRALEVEDDNLSIISSTRDVMAQLQELRTAKKEHFVVLYLNARNQLIHKETISVGTLNANLVHPREVFEPAIKNPCAHVIVAHNHPSGDPEPSQDDIEITGRLCEAGEILGIEIEDHIIVAKNNFLSLKERGVI
jgi:DNA repair protein RadC